MIGFLKMKFVSTKHRNPDWGYFAGGTTVAALDG